MTKRIGPMEGASAVAVAKAHRKSIPSPHRGGSQSTRSRKPLLLQSRSTGLPRQINPLPKESLRTFVAALPVRIRKHINGFGRQLDVGETTNSHIATDLNQLAELKRHARTLTVGCWREIQTGQRLTPSLMRPGGVCT